MSFQSRNGVTNQAGYWISDSIRIY